MPRSEVPVLSPDERLVDDDRTVSIREEIFYCIDHLSEAYPDDGDEGD